MNTGHVIWGDFDSTLERNGVNLFSSSRKTFKDECPGMLAIGGYVDGTLRGKDKKLVEEHLAQCPLCRRLAVDLYLLIQEEPAPPPEEFLQFLDGLAPGLENAAGDGA